MIAYCTIGFFGELDFAQLLVPDSSSRATWPWPLEAGVVGLVLGVTPLFEIFRVLSATKPNSSNSVRNRSPLDGKSHNLPPTYSEVALDLSLGARMNKARAKITA